MLLTSTPTSAATSRSSPTASSASTAATSVPTAAALSPVAPLLGRVVNEQGVQSKRVWKDEIPDVVAADADGVQFDLVAAFNGHGHALQVGVHGHVHPGN